MEKRTLRARKISDRLGAFDEKDRQRAQAARLEALENDQIQEPGQEAGSEDEDFTLCEDSEGELQEGVSNAKKRRKSSEMRKTRGMIAERSKGPKLLRDWVEEAQLDDVGPNYVTAAAPPPKTASRRKFCSICGSFSKYTCVRCGSLYCSARCSTVHVETRCLAFLS